MSRSQTNREIVQNLCQCEVTRESLIVTAVKCIVSDRTYKINNGIEILDAVEQCPGTFDDLRIVNYFLAVGHIKLASYNKSLHYLSALLEIDPESEEIMSLKTAVEKQIERDIRLGCSIVGGTIAVVAAYFIGRYFLSRK